MAGFKVGITNLTQIETALARQLAALQAAERAIPEVNARMAALAATVAAEAVTSGVAAGGREQLPRDHTPGALARDLLNPEGWDVSAAGWTIADPKFMDSAPSRAYWRLQETGTRMFVGRFLQGRFTDGPIGSGGRSGAFIGGQAKDRRGAEIRNPIMGFKYVDKARASVTTTVYRNALRDTFLQAGLTPEQATGFAELALIY